MDESNMVFAKLCVSLALLLSIPSINCSTGIRDAAGAGFSLDSSLEVLDDFCSFSSSVDQQHQHIGWEMSIRVINTFQDPYCGNSTPTALSAVGEDKECRTDDPDMLTLLNLTSFATHSNAKLCGGRLIEMDEASSSATTSLPLQRFTLSDDVLVDTENTFAGNYRRQKKSSRKNLSANICEEKDYSMLRGFSYDELVEKVYFEGSQVDVADTEISTDHYLPVNFTRPFGYLVDFSLPLGFTMVVQEKCNELNKFWWFLSPFTPELWLTVVVLTLFTGFVFWIIEGQEEDGPNLVDALLFFVQRASPRNILTYFVVVPWLLLILILTSTYTSILTSMVTSSETEPSCLDMAKFKIKNATIGCDEGSSIFPYLVENLGFQRKNIKNISKSSVDDYEKALSSGNIKAAFFSTPYADLFLAKYPKGFTAWEPIQNNFGSTIVFPRGSPFVSEISKLKEMQGVMLSLSDCLTVDDTTRKSVGPGTFSGLFILSGGASAIAVLITVIRLLIERWESFTQRMLMGRGLWVWLTALFSQNQMRNEVQLASI